MEENTGFCMPIEDILYIRERGLLVVGKVISGSIDIGDKVRFETTAGELTRNNVQVDGIEIFGTPSTFSEGMNIGLFFQIPYIKNIAEGLQALPIKSSDIIRK